MVKYIEQIDSIINKDWAAGSSKMVTADEYIVRGSTLEKISVTKPPSIAKIIDEVLVNVLDHQVRCKTVTEVNVILDKSGMITVINNGDGIPATLHEEATEKHGQDIYLPTFFFGILFQGTNFDNRGSIIGGTHGMGVKLTNCFSAHTCLETVHKGVMFKQTWENNMRIRHPHSITKVISGDYTKFSFMPDYKNIYKMEYKDFESTLYDILFTRAVFASIHGNYVAPINFRFTTGGTSVSLPKKITDLFGTATFVKDIVRVEGLPYEWEVVAISHDTLHGKLSFVNGIVIEDGKHLTNIIKQISDAAESRLKKSITNFNKKLITKNIFLFINAKIENVSWNGQTKDKLIINTESHINKYSLSALTANKIIDLIQDKIINSTFDTKLKTKKHKYSDKYSPAHFAGDKKKSGQCSLILAEGDSAMSQIKIGVTSCLDINYYGILSIGGVPINVRREVDIRENKLTKSVKFSEKLTKNRFVLDLINSAGLNKSYKYDPASKTYNKEIAELNYGKIIICVDQDHDGKGNILGSILSTFEILWPNLFANKFIYWFYTPLIRAYPHTKAGKILSFNTDIEFNNAGIDAKKYDIRYYKGLSTHSRDETIDMFKKFHDNLICFSLSEKSHGEFEKYYGKDPELRKVELSKPYIMESAADKLRIQTTKSLLCEYHLSHDTKLYQLDNLSRKLNHIIDGQNEAGRKILHGLMSAFTASGQKMRVAQLAGKISDSQNYHHGEMSLCDTITGKGYIGVGGTQLPFILPLSNFGSRLGNDAGSARYIEAKLNTQLVNILFNADDYEILEFEFDEGKRYEPKYFIPIIPLVLLESISLPAHGWKIELWARDVIHIISIVRQFIITNNPNLYTPLYKPCVEISKNFTWRGNMVAHDGVWYSVGKYNVVKDNTIIITELPLKVWTNDYILSLDKKENIISVNGAKSNDIIVHIEIIYKDGELNKLLSANISAPWCGVIEDLKLRKSMHNHINLMMPDNRINEFDNYTDILSHWFLVRRDHYVKRVTRKQKINEFKIRHLSNIHRFVGDAEKVVKKSEDDMNKFLSANNYDTFKPSKLSDTKFIPTELLEQEIITKGSYDYLLNLSMRDNSVEGIVRAENNLNKARDNAKLWDKKINAGKFLGAEIWLDELDELQKVIIRGRNTDWKFKDESEIQFA